MDGVPAAVAGGLGTRIGVLTSGSGSPLLLVHGGMRGLAGWDALWRSLVGRFEVTAMDRRGRGASGDTDTYSFDLETADVAAVVSSLAERHQRPVDVFGHSFGAAVALAAAASGAPINRLALYEPPGPETVSAEWLQRVRTWVAAGQVDRAVGSFLVEIVGYTRDQVERMRDSPLADTATTIATRTMVREATALRTVDLPALARTVRQPVLLLHGEDSPPWAAHITAQLANVLPAAEVRRLPGQGHDAVDAAPELLADHMAAFFRPCG